MARVKGSRVALGMRWVAIVQCVLLVATTSCVPWAARKPEPGVLEYRVPLTFDLPGGRLDLAGGNFFHRRVDLSIDTLLGDLEMAATYNSSTGSWRWFFEMTYDGQTFVDATGAVHEVGLLADGAAIPGTHWVKVDSQQIKTKGGLLHHFDAFNHRLVALTGLDGVSPGLTFFLEWHGAGVRTQSVAQCRAQSSCLPVYSLEYDANSCVAAVEDRAGRRAEFENDADCRPTVARDGLDVAQGWPGRRYEYDGDLLSAITNSEGERLEYEYDSGRLASVRQVGLSSEFARFRYGFEPLRQLFYTVVEDARGGRSVYRYDADARVHEIEDAAGDVTQMGWSGMRPSRRVGPDGATTRWFYQGDDVARTELPSGNVVQYEYAMSAQDRRRPLARPISRKFDLLGVIEERTYDAGGRLASVTDGSGDLHTFSYDPEGLLWLIVGPDLTWTWMGDYGEHGHAQEIARESVTVRRVFDAVGNLLEGADMRGRSDPGRPGMRRRTFDEDRNLVSLERVGEVPDEGSLQETAVFEFLYRSDGQATEIQRPYGGDTVYGYDAAGRLSERRDRVDGSWHTRSYEYSNAGDILAVELPNGMRSQAVYNSAGRPTRLSYFRDGLPESSVELIWQAGRLRHWMDSRRPGLETLVYDSAGRPIAVRFPEGEILERVYDLRSREIARRFVLTSGASPFRTLDFAYDLGNRPVLVFDQGEKVLDRRFSQGKISEIHYGNDLVRSFSYDWETGLLEKVELHGGTGSELLSTNLLWSQCEWIHSCLEASTMVSPSPGSSVPSGSFNESYVMGPRSEFFGDGDSHGGRIEGWAPSSFGGYSSSIEGDYGFDVLGNWLGVLEPAGTAGPFRFNAERNRLVASDRDIHHDYAWDEAGFLAARDGVSLHWNAAGLLTGMGESISLEWDSLGRPISFTSPAGVSRSLFGGAVSGDANRQPVAIDLGEVEIGLSGEGRTYRHHDFRGNVQAVSDEAGDLQKFYTYSPFGVDETFGAGGDSASFAGGEALGEFVILGARIYDPESGRFISPDPLYHSINQFAYTLGNPLMLWDPGGRAAELNPGSTPIGMAKNAVRVSMSLGAALLEGAGHFNSAALLLLGFGFLVMGTLATMVVMHFTSSSSTDSRVRGKGGRTGIEDMPAEGWPDANRPGESPGGQPELDPVACSPLAIGSGEPGSWAFGLIVPLQMVLAGLWVSRRRRSRQLRLECGSQ